MPKVTVHAFLHYIIDYDRQGGTLSGSRRITKRWQSWVVIRYRRPCVTRVGGIITAISQDLPFNGA